MTSPRPLGTAVGCRSHSVGGKLASTLKRTPGLRNDSPIPAPPPGIPHRLLRKVVEINAIEVRAVTLAFVCNFVLLASYYVLRPVRDAMATVFGVNQLQNLFTGTLILTLICSPAFAWLTDTFKVSEVLVG